MFSFSEVGKGLTLANSLAVNAAADAELSQLVHQGEQHAAAAYTSVFALGFDALQAIELPEGAETRVDRAKMRALASLYLAADLEPAGVFSAAEDLSALAATGALQLDLGAAGPLVHRFWRERNDRTTAAERLAFFGRLFGASYGAETALGANDVFETLMLELCEGFYKLGETLTRGPHGSISSQTHIRAAARNLLGNLAAVGGGATPFMAREVINGLKNALEILKQPHLQAIFGARDLWGVITAVSRLTKRKPVGDPQLFVRRGRAGMTIIAWLADAAEALRVYGAPLVNVDHPVIPAAVDWLQASLDISELQVSYQAAPVANPVTYVSDWADLGV